MARNDSIAKKGLKVHIDGGRDAQNGYGYDDFVRMITASRKPSYTAIGNLFNKDSQTIKKWEAHYIIESSGVHQS